MLWALLLLLDLAVIFMLSHTDPNLDPSCLFIVQQDVNYCSGSPGEYPTVHIFYVSLTKHF